MLLPSNDLVRDRRVVLIDNVDEDAAEIIAASHTKNQRPVCIVREVPPAEIIADPDEFVIDANSDLQECNEFRLQEKEGRRLELINEIKVLEELVRKKRKIR